MLKLIFRQVLQQRMNLLKIVSFCFLLLATSKFVAAADKAAKKSTKPNIVFIFADDYAYDCIAATGNTQIKTPHLDSMVKNGTTFTHAYNMGSYSGAVCIASRMMLNSGRFVWTCQKLHKNGEQERKEGRWWSEYMKKAGYETYMTGKWHLKASAEKSFKHVKHVRPGMPNQTKEGYNRPKADGSDTWDPTDPKFGGFWKGGKHWSEVIAEDSIEFMQHAGKQDKPFFMYLAFNAPHDPRQAPKKFVDMYPPEKMAIPKPFYPIYPHAEQMGAGKRLRDERLAPFPRNRHMIQVNRSEYYAIISHLDVQVGRILKALKKTGKADNTWIVFTADHGLGVGHHSLLGKQNMYDHSVRVPFMIIGPEAKKDQKISTPIYMQDIMPTVLQLAGVNKPAHVDFNSILPLLKDPKAKHYDAIYGGYLKLQRAVTQDGYKLILYPKASVAKLYHVAKDPNETKNLAKEATSKKTMKKLFAKLLQLQKETNDPLDLESVYPELAK